MEEKELIVGEKKNYGKRPLVFRILGILGLLRALLHLIVSYDTKYDNFGDVFYYLTEGSVAIYFFLGIAFLVYSILLSMICNSEIIVTNKRVYGKNNRGKQVDIPVDSISSVGTGAFNGISVASSSGRISFWGMLNSYDLHSTITNLLINRQKGVPTIEKKTEPVGGAEEIIKYKNLLDAGIITQEEFDAKKKQLLGL